jgi:hypothetical protein
MSETTAQASHELLLGMNRDMKNVLRALETISEQLLTLTLTVGPALGMCGSCAETWIETGENPGSPVSAAVTVVIAEGVGTIPVCMWHFREARKVRTGAQPALAQPVVPQRTRTGLILPGW